MGKKGIGTGYEDRMGREIEVKLTRNRYRGMRTGIWIKTTGWEE